MRRDGPGPALERLLFDRLLTAAALRSRVIAANVANQNTPDYRRRDVSFEERLVAELQRAKPMLFCL